MAREMEMSKMTKHTQVCRTGSKFHAVNINHDLTMTNISNIIINIIRYYITNY